MTEVRKDLIDKFGAGLSAAKDVVDDNIEEIKQAYGFDLSKEEREKLFDYVIGFLSNVCGDDLPGIFKTLIDIKGEEKAISVVRKLSEGVLQAIADGFGMSFEDTFSLVFEKGVDGIGIPVEATSPPKPGKETIVIEIMELEKPRENKVCIVCNTPPQYTVYPILKIVGDPIPTVFPGWEWLCCKEHIGKAVLLILERAKNLLKKYPT